MHTEFFCVLSFVIFFTHVIIKNIYCAKRRKSIIKNIYDLKQQGLPEPLFQIFLNIYSYKNNKNPFLYLDALPNSFERKFHL